MAAAVKVAISIPADLFRALEAVRKRTRRSIPTEVPSLAVDRAIRFALGLV